MIDTVFWIWFQLLFGIGTRRAELLLNYFDNPKEIYDGIATNNRVVGMLETQELKSSAAAMTGAAELMQRTLKKGCSIITPDHTHYPRLLQQIYSKPAALYVKGDLSCLQDALCIAIVGTRKRTEYGRDAASLIAHGLAAGGAVVVSGLAQGIDTDSHQAALEAGGKTIGVLGCGIDVDYPKNSAKVKSAMSKSGAVVTEYPLGTFPASFNFPMRNRIISGMSHGVVVVEADTQSGSIITAHHALEQGRDIFAVPGSIFSTRERGTHQLLRDGAKLTECADDIFEEYTYLGYEKKINVHNPAINPSTSITPTTAPLKNDTPETLRARKEKPPERQPLPGGVEDSVAQVYALLGNNPLTADDIAQLSALEMGKILSALTELEIYGLIQGYPGRKFGLK